MVLSHVYPCKLHNGTHRYTVCDNEVCRAQYCSRYWPTCPRCPGIRPVCQECGQLKNNAKHIRFGNDEQNPVKHRFVQKEHTVQNPFERLREALVEASNALYDLQLDQSNRADDIDRRTLNRAIDLALNTAQHWQERNETPRKKG